MSATKSLFFKLSIAAMVFCMVVISSVLMGGQPASKHRTGVPDDWSHHYLVFSNPGTYEQAVANGSYSRWVKLHYDTRFILQQMKRTTGMKPLVERGATAAIVTAAKQGMKQDWSQALTHGTATGTVQPNMFPAKWGASDVSSSCTEDYVAFPTGYVGSGTSATLVADFNLYSGCTGTVPSIYWAYNTGGTISTSPITTLEGSQVAFIQSNGTSASLVLLKWLASPADFAVSGTTVKNSATVTITSGSVTAADVGAQISGGGIPANDTIVAATGSTVTLASAATAKHSTPETLTIHAETVDKPGVALTVSNSAYLTCTAPCMTTLSLDGNNDTFSMPYYDYSSDAIYVGDDGGYLHKFTGVFSGTPTEAGSPWPVLLNTGVKISSPIYDTVSDNVFAGDTAGYLYSVPATGSSFAASSNLGDTIIDAPLVDSSLETVYAFVTTSGGNNTVYQFPATFTGGSSGNGSVAVGTGGAGYYLYAGTFDNVYYESATPAGNLWVIGNTGAATGPGNLFRIPINPGGSMGSPGGAVATLTGNEHPWPSPVTEFCNNGASLCTTDGTNTTAGTDYLFFSVNQGSGSGCTNSSGNGCILSYNVTTPSAPAQSGKGKNLTNPATPGCWATSGISVDNSDPVLTGASQIYFINLKGNSAGGPTIGTNTSSNCASDTTNNIHATQTSQANPN